MKTKDFKKIMSPVIKKSIEMTKAKEDWIKKIRNWREEFTESGIDTLIFSEVFPDEAKGYFYRDLNLSKESINDTAFKGTPVIIRSINCFIHASVDYTKDGEFYPFNYLYIEVNFYSTSDSSWVLENFPGDLIWKPYLFHTILDWTGDFRHEGIGFASTEYRNHNSPFPDLGWTMIFEDDNVRNLIIQKFKEVELSLQDLTPEGKTKPVLIFSK